VTKFVKCVLTGCKMTIKYRPRCFLDIDIDSKPGKAYLLIQDEYR